MKSLSGINVTDMNTLLQLSGTTQILTENSEMLSPTTQVRSKLARGAGISIIGGADIHIFVFCPINFF